MRSLINFWRKDIINKLIVVVVLLIMLALSVQAYLLVSTPVGQTLIGGLFPTPTLSVGELFEAAQATVAARTAVAAAGITPTITTMPFTPVVPTATATASPTAPAVTTATAVTETPAPEPSSTPTPSPSPTLAASASPAPTRPVAQNVSDLACLPEKPTQVGVVLEVLSGNTARVMIEGLVYTIRYIGVDVPEDPNFAQNSQYQNGQLVYGKEVTLYPDGPDLDDTNRLRRYVVAGKTHVNHELIRVGLARAASSAPDYACAASFAAAEQSAKKDGAGLWIVPRP